MKKPQLFFVSLLFLPLLVFAQNQVILPNPGLTPESPFYFLDKLGEALRTFFYIQPRKQSSSPDRLRGRENC